MTTLAFLALLLLEAEVGGQIRLRPSGFVPLPQRPSQADLACANYSSVALRGQILNHQFDAAPSRGLDSVATAETALGEVAETPDRFPLWRSDRWQGDA
jgi:hypothetical protein